MSAHQSRPVPIIVPAVDAKIPDLPSMRVRGRSASLVKVEEVHDHSVEDALDREMYVNMNVNWTNAKGAWLIHIVLIAIGKIAVDTVPGMTQQISWTLVNLIYLTLTYVMFHGITGVPFESDMHGGAYDELTMWEQIDDGAQHTPAKKWLFFVPVALFLISTHYTNYNLWLFVINFSALIFVLLPKLPQFHRHRLRFMPDSTASGVSTPLTPSFPSSGAATPITGHIPTPRDITEAHFDH
ncbi:Orm1 type endoplasmic reticulum protein [Fistulina hepatica ATCC 64428]|uniref:Orm1 type endoplasmic reticulum protein n=1 Tax=Fistulina hepatica ATCC 64428 TaxID=1128425 RepID=A0A0D7ANF4_9AGAR|nr:Orm1 type endoplasmic reticulum protein [Fistulina hepatica ATCC 64428]